MITDPEIIPDALLPDSVQDVRRRKLVEIARREGELRLRGNPNHAGPAIEPYLAVFRDALNDNSDSDHYTSLETGYQWCCAFVYYCCLQAGFRFPPKPIPAHRHTLAAVPAWRHWAVSEGFFFSPGDLSVEPGDIALFNHLATNQPLDHIGIVVEIVSTGILCAEGNVENRTGLFARPLSCVAGYVRLPQYV